MRTTARCAVLASVALMALAQVSSASAARHRAALMHVQWMKGATAAGTPARFNRVGVLKIGSPKARNVLVFEPGTSAGSAYIVPLAQWLIRAMPGWQVWSVERRQNLLEDQSVLTRAKEGTASATAVFNYYLGWLTNPKITKHIRFPTSVNYAKGWGLNLAMRDLRIVVRAARRLGGKVVLSGHSLGGALVTAYATWNFGGRPGADDLAGLVFDDGASFRSAVTRTKAARDLAALKAPNASPWGGVSSPTSSSTGPSIPTPYLGLFSTTGALATVQQPNQPSLGQTFPALPRALNPPVRVTNLALFAYNTNVSTSKLGDFAVYAHEGRGIAPQTHHGVHGWNGKGALTPARRWATMLAGPGVAGADGLEWYFPYRLTLDIFDALNNGISTPAQKVLGVHATMGRRLPHSLLMYAFGAAIGQGIDTATVALARQSHIPRRNLTLVDRHGTYAHNDPAGAYPKNAFFTGLVRFLERVDAQR